MTRQLPEDDKPRSLLSRLRDRGKAGFNPGQSIPFGGGYQGPFADPPEEPIALDPDLPWELRE